MKKSLFTLMMITTCALGAADASPSNGAKVQCADGTIFTLNDSITADVACEYHGGISKSKLISVNGLQTDHAIPTEPDMNHVLRNIRVVK